MLELQLPTRHDWIQSDNTYGKLAIEPFEPGFALTVGIASSQINFAGSAGLGFLMAQAVFASLPILIVYMFFQKYIVRAESGAAAT